MLLSIYFNNPVIYLITIKFLFYFISPVLAPSLNNHNYAAAKKPTGVITSGPYKFKSWKSGSKIVLENNTHYKFGNPQRPDIEFYFIEDDTTALNLYDQGVLNFLRRVGVSDIPALSKNKDFIQLPMARMDYLGFGNELKPHHHLRKALAHALDYKQLAKIYHALGRPGCPSLLQKYYGKPICYDFDLKLAKKHFKQVPESLKKKRWKLYYSKLGGESIKKGMEWIQSQWKTHLGLTVDLEPMETTSYLAKLTPSAPALFRKGVSIDRPTCRAALEIFNPDHRENYIHFNNKDYVTLVGQMDQSKPSNKSKCRKAIQTLMDSYVMLPMGEIHFSLRVRPEVTGWDLNELNQLNLADLKVLTNK